MHPNSPRWKNPRLRYFAPEDDELGGGKPADEETPTETPEPTDGKPAGGTPTPKDVADAAAAADGDESALPKWARDRLKKADKEAASARTSKNDAVKQAADEAKKEAYRALGISLGLQPEEESQEDALARITREHNERGEKLTAAETRLRNLQIKDATRDALSEHKAKPSIVAFMRGEGLFDKLDPDDDEFAAQVAEAVKTTVEKYPEFAATPVPDSLGGNGHGGDQPAKPEASGVDARRAERAKRRGF